MELINISKHPEMPGIDRKVKVQEIKLNFQTRTADLFLEIHHFKTDGTLFNDLDRGIITIKTSTSDQKFVDATGIPVPADTQDAIPEFTFLFNFTGQGTLGEQIQGLIQFIVNRNDTRGNFTNPFVDLI